MILNETRDSMMIKTFSPTASSSTSSTSSSSSSPKKMESTELISSLTVKCKTGSDSCLTQLVKLSDQATKIEQFSRKLSEFDLKLNGFKPRSGHLHLTNSTTTTTTTTSTSTSTRLTTTSTASPSRSTTGPGSIRSSLPNFISHLTDRELETQHETDLIKKNKIYSCDSENENFGDKNINKSDGDSDQPSNIETNSKINRRRKCLRDQISRESNYGKNSGDDELSSTSESIKRLTFLPRSWKHSAPRSSTSKSLQSSPIDINIGSTHLHGLSSSSSPLHSSSSPTTPSESSGFVSSSPSSSPRRMRSSSQLISSKLQSETNQCLHDSTSSSSSSVAYDCVDYVNSLEDPPQPRISRYKSNRLSKESNPTSTCNLKPAKSTRSYSRLNSLPCNKNSYSNDFNDENISKPTPRNCLRAFSIPNGLNSESTTSPSHRSNSISNSRESLDHGLNSGETSSHQRIVGSLLDSPKWSIIKEKFEKSSNNNNSNNGNNSENKDKTEIVVYSSPQLRRKTYPTSTSNLTPSLSLSNLTLLSANNCGKARSISLTPSFSSSSSSTATMDKKVFQLQSANNETNKCNNRYSTSSLKSNSSSASSYSSSSHSTSSTLTNGSYVDRPNSFSTDRLTSTTATSLSPLSSSYSLENHGNYPIERMCSSGKVHLEQSVRMKSNSRIAKIASKFDSGANQSGSNTSLNSSTLIESKTCKSKSDLREFNKMITTSSSSSTTSLLTVVKQSSECNFSEQSEKSKKSKFTSNNSISSPPSSSSLSSLTDAKSIRNEDEEEKIVSVKETILRLECIKASTVDSIHQSGAKINRSISDQQSTKPVISSRRKTLPGATFLHNGSLSAVNINENNDNQNTLSLPSDSNHALPSNLLKDSGKSDKVPIPAPRKISNNQDSYMTKGVKSSSSSSSSSKTTTTLNTLVSSSSSSTTFLSSSLSRHGHELNKESNACKFNKNDKIEGNHETLKDSSYLSSSLSLPSSTKLLSFTSEEIKKTPSFLWSNNNHNFNNRLAGTSCSSPSSTVNLKESARKENLLSESSQCVKESNNIESNIAIEEPIYEPVSYSTTSTVNISNSNSSVNRILPSNNLSTINRDNRTIIHDYDDNLSLTSENSSLTYSDSGSYSSGVHEASTLSSSASSSNRSNRVIPSTHPILPPPLPPRWTEASKQGNSTTFTSTANIINPISSNGLSLTALDTYLSNQWDNKDDCYGADHIYDSIYYNNLSDELTLDKSEALSKLLKELENMSPTGDRNAKEDTNSTNSSGASMSRTPSTLSCSSVSRNGSNASESRDKSSDEFSSGIVILKSCESSSSLESIRNTSCLSSQVPPKITPRTTIKSTHESNSGGYANFPSIMENKILSSGSLMDSILESSSPSLRETIQREMKRSEYHSRLHQSETLMKNSSFLHSNRLSVVSKKSSDYVEAINPADQKKPNINDLYREGLIHPESRYETHEYEGYMEFKETRGFFSSTAEQPLYQLYDEQVKHNRILWASGLADDSQEEADPLDAIYAELDGVSCACSSCELDDGTSPTASITPSIVSTTSATPHISAIDLVGKNGNRQLWCEVPQVKEAGVAAKLTPKERKHQEAMFEVITSEASYLKSLDILVNHFMKSEEFSNPEILNSHDRSDLFSNIESVFEITRRLMKDLDDRWQTNVVISDVCDILLRYATSEFEDYVKYLRFCKKQEKTLKTLQKQPKFAASLKQLETNPKCHGLALTSFLLLPMQRITRYPLLVEAILNHRAPTETDKHELCQNTLAALYTVVNDCNEEAKKTGRLQELIDLDSILNFDKVKYFPLISESRYLMKKDEVVRLKQTSSSIIPARGRNPLWKKSPLHLYLFNDLLLIASKKSEIYYSVNDYCERNCLTVRSMDVPGEEITPPIGMKSSLENLIQLTFLKNHARRTSEYYIAFPTETDKIRFIEAIEPPKSDKPNEKIYEEWDCPQVICERQYTAQQPDELSLEKSDVVNVFRKTNDWYEGERIRDGARGWFPASCTQEIVNKHVRSRNLKLRHRLMTLTDKHILDMQKS